MRYDEDELELMSDEVFEELESATVACDPPRRVPTPGHWIECPGPDDDCRNSVWYRVAPGDTVRGVAAATLRANGVRDTRNNVTRYLLAMNRDLSNRMFGPTLVAAFRPVWTRAGPHIGRRRCGSGYGLILLPKVRLRLRMHGPGADYGRRAAGTAG
jgi:hypothetical protein